MGQTNNDNFNKSKKIKIRESYEYNNTDDHIGRLMHDFSCKEAKDMINPILRERVRVLKETEGGRDGSVPDYGKSNK